MFGLSSFFHTCVHNKGPSSDIQTWALRSISSPNLWGKKNKNPALVKSNVFFLLEIKVATYIYIGYNHGWNIITFSGYLFLQGQQKCLITI